MRRYKGTRRVKIKNPEEFRDAGYLVTKKKYKYRGKTKTGFFAWIRPEAKGSRIYATKNTVVERTKKRKTLRVNVPDFALPLFLDDAGQYIKGDLKIKKIKLGRKKPVYKLLFPAGEGRFEYEDVKDLENYLEKMGTESKNSIVGYAVVTHG